MSTFSSAPSAPTPAPPPPPQPLRPALAPPTLSVPLRVMTPPRPTNRFAAWLRRPRSTGEGMAMGAVALIVGVIGLSLAWRAFWWLQVFFAYFATVGTLDN